MMDDTAGKMNTEPGAMPFPATTLELSDRLGQRLRALRWTCATAESCTGGGIGHAITAIPGSSDYFVGGLIAYANRVKTDQLGVSPDTIASVGAVSAECACEMARGVRERFGVDLGISSTGIAGPTGATARKPVGLVYVAVSTTENEQVQELRLSGDRLTIMGDSVAAALVLAVRMIGADAPQTEQ
jgi:PncC family amidohydrolase